jgi:hypothetical protein
VRAAFPLPLVSFFALVYPPGCQPAHTAAAGLPLANLSTTRRVRTLQAVDFNEAIIDERNEEIMQINRAVLEVNDVMRDLATMVVEQQRDIGA